MLTKKRSKDFNTSNFTFSLNFPFQPSIDNQSISLQNNTMQSVLRPIFIKLILVHIAWNSTILIKKRFNWEVNRTQLLGTRSAAKFEKVPSTNFYAVIQSKIVTMVLILTGPIFKQLCKASVGACPGHRFLKVTADARQGQGLPSPLAFLSIIF